MKYEFKIEDLLRMVKNCLRGNDSIDDIIKEFINQHELKEPLKIEVGKFYRNRYAYKCIVLYQNKYDNKGEFFIDIIGTYPDGYWVSTNGKYYLNDNGLDIISEWTEQDEKEWREKQ